MKIEIELISEVNLKVIDEVAALEADNFGDGALNRWHLPVMVRYGKVFVIKAEGIIAGAAEMMADWQQFDHVFIIGFSISKTYQSQGLGKKLMRAIIDFATNDNRSYLSLTVARDNTSALKLYSKLGFKEIRKLKNEYGPGVDRLLLRLDLGDSHE